MVASFVSKWQELSRIESTYSQIPVGFVVVAPFPGDAVLLAEFGLLGADAQALHPAQFTDGIRLHIYAREPLCKHAAGDLGVLLLIGPRGSMLADIRLW
jgi:hypothetical protein